VKNVSQKVPAERLLVYFKVEYAYCSLYCIVCIWIYVNKSFALCFFVKYRLPNQTCSKQLIKSDQTTSECHADHSTVLLVVQPGSLAATMVCDFTFMTKPIADQPLSVLVSVLQPWS